MSDLAFLLGVPRSGTTLLASLLNQHPQLHCPAEPWLLLALAEFGRVHPAAACGPRLLQRALDDFLPGAQRDRLLAQWAASAYRSRLEPTGRRVFIDKTPRYLHLLDRLDAWFPAAPRLVLIRHPLDVAVSMMQAWGVDLVDVVGRRLDHRLALDFCLGHARLAALAAAPGPCTALLRYEDLVQDAERTLAPAWSVLGVAPAAIDAAHPDGPGNPATAGRMGDAKIRDGSAVHARSVGQWRSQLDAHAVRILAGALGRQIIEQLGYGADFAGFAWPTDPLAIDQYAAYAQARTAATREPDDEVTPALLARLPELLSATDLLAERDSLRYTNARLEAERTQLQESVRQFEAANQQPSLRHILRLSGRRLLRLVTVRHHDGRPMPLWLHRLASCRLGVLRQYPPRPLPRTWRRPACPEPAGGWPMISLVTPSFRQGAFIARTLDSVLDQGYPNLEYIVQDGGSSDATVGILTRYAPRLSAWASGPDGGQTDAINRGFARSHGAIMGWLNSDDLLLPGALACVAGHFAAHPEVDAVYGDRIVIDEEDREVGRWVLPAHQNEILRYVDYVPQETLFWRRSAWERIGGRLDPSFGFAMDWDLLLRLQAAGARIVHLPFFLGAFRVHGQQKTHAILEDVGMTEMRRLRRREFDRDLGQDEIDGVVKPYVLRALIRHRLRRLVLLG